LSENDNCGTLFVWFRHWSPLILLTSYNAVAESFHFAQKIQGSCSVQSCEPKPQGLSIVGIVSFVGIIGVLTRINSDKIVCVELEVEVEGLS